MAKEGKQFEDDIEKSCGDQSVFFYRIKDTFIPPDLRTRVRVTKNKYDSFVYKYPNLFPIELKSTKGKSFSFSDKIIKGHQINALKNAVEYDGLIAGFIFNFREYDNFTSFVHINDFIHIKELSQKQIIKHNYKSKLNKSGIGLDIVKEVGHEIKNVKKVKKYRYYIKTLLDELIEKYNS